MKSLLAAFPEIPFAFNNITWKITDMLNNTVSTEATDGTCASVFTFENIGAWCAAVKGNTVSAGVASQNSRNLHFVYCRSNESPTTRAAVPLVFTYANSR